VQNVAITVIQPGLLTTIQDRGRHGYEHLGFPASGAFDPFLASIANHLTGNESSAALLEFSVMGPTLKFHQPTVFAIAAFDCRFLLDGKEAPLFQALQAETDSILQFQQMQSWFGYIAFAGGLDAPHVLGSASTYVAGKIGDRLKKDEALHTRTANGTARTIDPAALGPLVPQELWLLPGLHMEMFADRETVERGSYRILSQSNRMGIYLSGDVLNPPLVRRSAPALNGTVQILPSGEPLILGPEGPVTGGYPQLAVLSRSSWTTLARSQPNGSIKLEWHSIEEASEIWQRRMDLLTV